MGTRVNQTAKGSIMTQLTTARAIQHHQSLAILQENDLKSNLMKMIEAFKEEIKKFLKEIKVSEIKWVGGN